MVAGATSASLPVVYLLPLNRPSPSIRSPWVTASCWTAPPDPTGSRGELNNRTLPGAGTQCCEQLRTCPLPLQPLHTETGLPGRGGRGEEYQGAVPRAWPGSGPAGPGRAARTLWAGLWILALFSVGSWTEWTVPGAHVSVSLAGSVPFSLLPGSCPPLGCPPGCKEDKVSLPSVLSAVSHSPFTLFPAHYPHCRQFCCP